MWVGQQRALPEGPCEKESERERERESGSRMHFDLRCVPSDLGSTLTSSESGSCTRRPRETAPRIETSIDGSSETASADAE
eukprot:3505533-Prymnesium_polylepis.2